MGSCVSSPLDPVQSSEKAINQQINSVIDQDARKLRNECKILLLGAGESGKSTIVKQMKIIHQNGYTQQELERHRPIVQRNLFDSAHTLILEMRKLSLDCSEPRNRAYTQLLLDYYIPPDVHNFLLPPAFGEAIASLWRDPVVPRVMDRPSFYLMDSAAYFFSHAIRICQQGYIPNETDVLRARVRTTGIAETRFHMGLLSIHMFDVGGQRPERKKWISCFEAVTSIIFCVAMSEYDQGLLESPSQNRMKESLLLFDSIVNSRWFLRTSIILFLNKIDVFKAKLPKSPLDVHFPKYAGGPDLSKAAKFILWMFNEMNRAGLSMYPHLTQATDTSNIRLVFIAVKETILQNSLRDAGML